MIRLLILSVLLCGLHCRADITTEPWPKKLQDFPSKARILTLRNFKITVRPSNNQEGAGSGGGIYDFTIQNTSTGAVRRFTEQSVGVAILEFCHGWPQLEIWGRGGGGNWSRGLIRFTRRDYEEVRVDAFTEFDFNAKDKTRTTTMPGGDDTLYYVETRLPDK
ncbi:hypothetical protein CfE428DRAFT_2196 [Chthoniobacter flavus Ellin428]|uniref:Uncharacterized protein n=1 Tax=Chthoniobacter flavus Ellin428 TaxID=497964 RepID=B4CZV8_9BACT|nr:hypothetical protein [Chthoniobacter flavus]EDY20272.1 hypothetical protein CfE428DRAFT_2196 [Chthoniobacter flavus Ellin428]TCO94169.1 hypothetical protein EV701_103258 [Chthoniobacter flavus]